MHSNEDKALAFRGYIGSRKYTRDLPPQNIQNQIVRDYCTRQNANFLLSLTEYAMPESYIMLEETLRELDAINGLVLYSIFMLPKDANHRQKFISTLLDHKVSIHGAAENIKIQNEDDWYRVDDMLTLHYSLDSSHLENLRRSL